MGMTVSMSVGRVAILHDIRKEISMNVDPERTKKNEIFIDELKDHNHDVVAYTDAHFQPYIDQFNEGKKNCRQIHGTYTEHLAEENEKLEAKVKENKAKGINRNVRKPTKLVQEYVLQFGNRENNSTLPMEGEFDEKGATTRYFHRMNMNKKGLKEAVEQMQEKYPHAHILLATYHQDEPNGTPHVHVLVQFEGENYEKGLSHRISMSKALELDGFERSGNRGDYAVNRWEKDIQDNILSPIMERSFNQEREILEEHRKHEDIVFFRKKARAEAEALEKVKEVKDQAENELKTVKNEIKLQEVKKKMVGELVEKSKGELNEVKQTVETKKTESRRLDDEINEKKEQSRGYDRVKTDYEKLKKDYSDIKTEVERKKKEKSGLQIDIDNLKQKKLDLGAELKTAQSALNKANAALDKVKSDLEDKTGQSKDLDDEIKEKKEELRNVAEVFGKVIENITKTINEMVEKACRNVFEGKSSKGAVLGAKIDAKSYLGQLGPNMAEVIAKAIGKAFDNAGDLFDEAARQRKGGR